MTMSYNEYLSLLLSKKVYFCRRKVVKDFVENPERETGVSPVQYPLL